MNWRRILIGRWSWKRPIISLSSIYILLFLIAVFFADRLIFIPPPASYNASLVGLSELKTPEDETIAYVHFKAAPGSPTLLYSHGNSEDLADSLPLFEQWNSRGLGVIAYDYPGYGLSSGRSTENSSQAAIALIWEHLRSSGISEKSIVIVGRSVGSGPSTWLANSKHPAGLVLISPFTSTFSVAFPVPLFPRDRFPNLKRIQNMDLPLLIIHGENDEVIPFKHGETLFAASSSDDKTFLNIPNAGHNDLFVEDGEKILGKIMEFANRISSLPQKK